MTTTTTTTLNELLGEKLLQNNESNDKTDEVSTNELNGKTLVLYFSAHWCRPCRHFTPKLVEAFKEAKTEIKNKLDIVFISWDRDETNFDEYFKEMPWKSLPFSDRQRSNMLSEKFQVQGIPTLVVLSSSYETLSLDGVEEIRVNSKEALNKWSEGKCLLWSREAKEDEYVWEGMTCHGCYLNPIVGSRYGCINRECQTELCNTCLTKINHEHPLVEYLIPKQKYSLEKFLSSIPYLIQSNKEENIETKTFLQNNIKTIGFYFSAHWCPPCRAFTPFLAELYKEAKTKNENFEIIFISCDRDENSFNDYRSQMPWPTAPLHSTTILKEYFQPSGIPALVIVSSDGKILTRNGREDVGRIGIEALQIWAKGEKVIRPTGDKYEWPAVCDGCQTHPIIGQRYHCPTCGNYDLCSTCQQKGHEHPLVLEPQPKDEDDD